MAARKYAGNIVTGTKPLPEQTQEVVERAKAKYGGKVPKLDATRLLWLDDATVKGAFYMEFLWLWKGSSEIPMEETHRHDFEELIGFIGTNREDPHDLGGEIDIWLGDEKHRLTKSSLVFIPKGLKHCPIQFNKIERPILWFTTAPHGMYNRVSLPDDAGNVNFSSKPAVKIAASKYGKYIVKKMKPNLKFPKPKGKVPANFPKVTRILWLDDEVAKDACYMECLWVGEGSGSGGPGPHTHDFDEVLGFIGSNPQNPKDLCGEVELWLDDEKYLLHKSCLVFIPKGVKHCPMSFNRVDTPVFHFSMGNGSMYTKAESK